MANMTVRTLRAVQTRIRMKAAGFASKEKLDIALAISSSENVLKEMDVNSASSSSGFVGMPIP